MNKRTFLLIAAGMSVVAAGPAPASSKPCRDKDGRIVACAKVRKSAPRCKDAQGRFAACPTPADDKAVARSKPPA